MLNLANGIFMSLSVDGTSNDIKLIDILLSSFFLANHHLYFESFLDKLEAVGGICFELMDQTYCVLLRSVRVPTMQEEKLEWHWSQWSYLDQYPSCLECWYYKQCQNGTKGSLQWLYWSPSEAITGGDGSGSGSTTFGPGEAQSWA